MHYERAMYIVYAKIIGSNRCRGICKLVLFIAIPICILIFSHHLYSFCSTIPSAHWLLLPLHSHLQLPYSSLRTIPYACIYTPIFNTFMYWYHLDTIPNQTTILRYQEPIASLIPRLPEFDPNISNSTGSLSLSLYSNYVVTLYIS